MKRERLTIPIYQALRAALTEGQEKNGTMRKLEAFRNSSHAISGAYLFLSFLRGIAL